MSSIEYGVMGKRIIRPAHDTVFHELEGELVLLNLASEQYYTLNDTGTRMWHVLTQADSVEAACETLLDEFDVEADHLCQDLEMLIARLLQANLITVEHGD
jgi:hypothetical protein